jgi:hypothetical protein
MNTVSTTSQSVAERYHFIVPLWGAKFVDMFVNQSLPSQLAKGNLGSLPAAQTSYQIFTHAEDAEAIWESSSVKKLRGMVDVSLSTFTNQQVERDYVSASNPYHINLKKMSWCYEQGIKGLRGLDTAFILMTPDSVWANGAFRYVHECQCSGVRALMALGLITLRPVIQERLGQFRCQVDPNVIDIPPRKLVKLACDALHPLGACRIVKHGGNRFPCAYYWTKPGKGLVARCFYLHPVMVRPLVHLDRLPSTVDYRYVQQACPDLDQIRIVTDSDKLFYIDMADVGHEAGELTLHNRSRMDRLKWMCQWTEDFHRAYFRQPIVLRESDDDERFEDELAECAAFAATLLEDFEQYYPTSRERLSLCNVFGHSRTGAHPCLRTIFRRCLSRLKRATLTTLRRVYRGMLRKLYDRLDCLERDVKVHSISTEYELRREISLLRAAVETRNELCRSSTEHDSSCPRSHREGS